MKNERAVADRSATENEPDNETQNETEAELLATLACSLMAPRVKMQILQELSRASGHAQRRDVVLQCAGTSLDEAKRVRESAEREGIQLVSLLSPHYPRLLRETAAPPFVLYVRAKDSFVHFSEDSIAIVGTRAASIAECEDAKRFARVLCESGITVVSGLALGIDGAAHRGVLVSTRPAATVAVLAHGLTQVYPPSHTRLAETIIDYGGFVVSEYPPCVEARKHHFLERNRIIAGLVRGVVVFQAGARSGSLVTARCAADYGRDVFVFARQESERGNEGGERLADEGAQVVSSADDVLLEYGVAQAGSVPPDGGQVGRDYSHQEFEEHFGVGRAKMLEMELNNELIHLPGGRIRVFRAP